MMKRILLLTLACCLVCLTSWADEQKKVSLSNEHNAETVQLSFCNLFVRLNGSDNDESGTISIEMENLDESKVLIVFDRAYAEKAIKKQKPSIVFDKTFGGKAKERSLDPCSGQMNGVLLLQPSDKERLTDITVNNEEATTCRIPIYIAKNKGGKKFLLLEKQVIELNIEAELKPSEEYIAIDTRCEDLEKEIGRQTFCPNPKHKTSLTKQKDAYVKKIDALKADIDKIIADHKWEKDDMGYIRYNALKEKLDGIDLSSRERDCGRHGKSGGGGGGGHNCNYCSLTLQQIYHQMDDYYKKIYSSSDRKAAKAKVMKNVDALYKCCTDAGCSKHASTWKSGGEYKSKIIERYNRISNL